MASVKEIPIGTLAATTGGNVNVITGAYTFPNGPTDSYSVYRLTGTQTLSSDLDLVASGALSANISIRIINESVLTLGGNSLTIFGITVPDAIATQKFIADCVYNGSAWTVVIYPNASVTEFIGTSQLVDDAVTEDKIGDDAVNTDQIKAQTAGSVLYWNASGNPAILDISTDGMIPIGDATGTVAGYVMSGDATMTKGGVVTVNSVKKLNSKYSATGTTAVTTEETLWSHTLDAGELGSDGEGIKVEIFGTVASNANTKTIRVKADGNTIVSNGTTTAPNGLNWEAEMTVLRSGATSSVSKGMIAFDGVADEVDTSKPGITWANAIPISVTGQNGTASANDIVVELVVLTRIK